MKQKETQIGPYEIKAKIGQGGTSVVYRAVDTRNQRVVALKVLTPLFATDPKFLRRFINEGQNVKRLDHPNIVQIYETNEADGRQYIAMELVEGGSLSELIKNRNSLLPIDEALNVIEQIAAALDYAHGLGILHRDIKLSNILLTQDGRALLTDFGSAKHMYGEHTVVTQSGFSVGTPTFMSPEQAKGDPNIDRRTDVYSLGVAAYAILVGRLPFKADSQVALLHKIIYDAPPLPELVNPDIAPGIAYALKRVLSKEPPMRYSTAGEFAAALIEGKSWVPGTQDYTNIPIFPHGTGSFFVPQQPKPDNRRWLGVLALFLLFGISALGIILALIIWSNPDLTSVIVARATEPVITNNGSTSVTTSNTSKPLEVIYLDTYNDVNNRYSVIVPKEWMQIPGDDSIIFEAREFFARLIIQRIGDTTSSDTPTTVVDKYLESTRQAGETYRNPNIVSDETQNVEDREVRELVLDASWLGTNVRVKVLGFHEHGEGYVLVSIMDPQHVETLSTVLERAARSFEVTSPSERIVQVPSVAETAEKTLTPGSLITGTPDNTVIMTGTMESDATTPTTATTVEITVSAADGTSTFMTQTVASSSAVTSTVTSIPILTETPEAGLSGTKTPTTPVRVAQAPTAVQTTNAQAESSENGSDGTTNISDSNSESNLQSASDSSTLLSAEETNQTTEVEPTETTLSTATETSTPVPPSPTSTPTLKPTSTNTYTPVPPTPTSTPISTNTETNIPEPTATPTQTPEPTNTETNTPEPTATPTQTPEPTNTKTNTPEPTSTPTQTPEPTNTKTNTPEPTSTPTLTSEPTNTKTNTPIPATSTPTKTPTLRPTATNTDTATFEPTVTETNTRRPTSTNTPTDTPIVPTDTPTSRPTRTPTDTPEPTLTPRPTSTDTPEPTDTPVPTDTPLPPPTPVIGPSSPIPGAAIQPSFPPSNESGGGRVSFEWTSNFIPRDGQGYELVFWRPGQAPVASSFGLAASTTNTIVSVDLSSLDDTLGELLEPGIYHWGVLLVQREPYRRVQYLGGGWQYEYVRSSGGRSRSPSSGE